MRNQLPERETFICNCHSLEHQYHFWWDDDANLLHVEPYLESDRNFFQRLWYGLKYIFGHKSRLGTFDEFSFKPEDANQLRHFLNRMDWMQKLTKH